jgi:hypothetical protein
MCPDCNRKHQYLRLMRIFRCLLPVVYPNKRCKKRKKKIFCSKISDCLASVNAFFGEYFL